MLISNLKLDKFHINGNGLGNVVGKTTLLLFDDI